MKEMILFNVDMDDFREILREVLREELKKGFAEQYELILDKILLSRKEAAEIGTFLFAIFSTLLFTVYKRLRMGFVV